MTIIGISIKCIVDGQAFYPEWYQSVVTAMFVLSLGLNTLVTSLIVYKITTVFHEIRRGFNTRNVRVSNYGNAYGQRDLYPLVSILVESGLMAFVGQLAQSILFKVCPTVFPLISGSVVIIYVRASCRFLF